MASEQVLKAFKRFDQDGSGSISREELGQVLKTLDEDWEDSSIDRLLSDADESGDGELQVAEFVRWVFAEDSAVFATKDAFQPEFTIRIQGCPLQGLNGDYIQQKKCYGRRPIFVKPGNSHTRQLLYYNKESQRWMIGKSTNRMMKVGTARLQTHRAVHLAGPDACWEVKVQVVTGKGEATQQVMKKAPKMTAVLPPPKSVEELIAESPSAVVVMSRWEQPGNNKLSEGLASSMHRMVTNQPRVQKKHHLQLVDFPLNYQRKNWLNCRSKFTSLCFLIFSTVDMSIVKAALCIFIRRLLEN